MSLKSLNLQSINKKFNHENKESFIVSNIFFVISKL
jgi:hypothetical protein